MKLICERGKLEDALKTGAVLAKAKSKIVVLGHTLLDAHNASLVCSSTDLEAYCEARTPAEVSAPGRALAPADQLTRLIASLPEGSQVELDAIENELLVKCGKSKYRIPTLAPADWPEFPAVKDAEDLTLSAPDVERMFGAPIGACSNEETRFYLTGAYLHQVESGLLGMVATDGIKLLRISIRSKEALRNGRIIPSEALTEIVHLAKGETRIAVGSNLIEARSGAVVYRAKLIDATFPDYRRILPSTESPTIAVNRAEFISAAKRLQLVAEEKPVFRLSWSADGDELTISLRGKGEGSEIVPAQIGLSEDGEIGFVPSVLLPVLSQIKGDRVMLHIAGPGDACLLADESDPGFVGVLMPYRVPQ